MKIIHLRIPMEVPSQNVRDRWHWAQRDKDRRKWEQWFCYASQTGGRDKAEGPRRVTIIAHRKALIRDHANLVGGAKGLVDALVRSGLLVDDNDKSAQIEYRQELAKKDAPFTDIHLEDM